MHFVKARSAKLTKAPTTRNMPMKRAANLVLHLGHHLRPPHYCDRLPRLRYALPGSDLNDNAPRTKRETPHPLVEKVHLSSRG
jgi:hypothetical protein